MSIVAAELVARVSADTDQAERDLRDFGSRMGSKGGPLGGMLDVFGGNLLAGAVQGIGRGIMDVGRMGVGAFVDMASSGADFEAQMDAVSAVLGGTAADAEALGDMAIQMAIDPTLKVNAQEAAEAITNLATAGLTADQILGGATKATILLANSTGGSFGQAAGVATDVMALFNIEAGDMMDAVDGIAAVSNVSKFDLDDYALALSQAGGVAALSGVEFEEFNAVIAATSPYFASGSDAGTSFKTFLQRLQPTTQEAKDLMFELGLVTEDGTNAFYNANGELKDMNEIYGVMNRTFGPMTEAQKTFYMGQIFGTDAMRTAGAMAGMTEQDFNDLLKTMGESSALDSARIRTDNFKSAMENLDGAVEAVKLSMWDAFEPAAQMIVEALSPVVDWAAPQLTALAQSIGAWLQEKIPEVEVAVKAAYELTGSPLASVMTGLAELTGAGIEFDALGIVKLDWGFASMEFDALGNVEMFWNGKLVTASMKWGPETPLEIDASINWDNVGEELKAAAFPHTNTWWDLFELPDQIYTDAESLGAAISAQFTETRTLAVNMVSNWGETWTRIYTAFVDLLPDWGATWSQEYNAGAKVAPDWGATWDTIYNAFADITPDWGETWSKAYSLIVDLIPNWLGGGDEPPPPAGSNWTDNGWSADENATGNAMFGGGLTWVGERGPELVRLPRTSRIYDDQESARMVGQGMTVNNYNTLSQPHDIEMLAQRVAAHMGRRGR